MVLRILNGFFRFWLVMKRISNLIFIFISVFKLPEPTRNATLDILWNFQDNAVSHLNMDAVSRHTQLWFNV